MSKKTTFGLLTIEGEDTTLVTNHSYRATVTRRGIGRYHILKDNDTRHQTEKSKREVLCSGVLLRISRTENERNAILVGNHAFPLPTTLDERLALAEHLMADLRVLSNWITTLQ